MPERCIISLLEGEVAGGDKRGRMSASINYSIEDKKIMQLNIDYSKYPLRDLLRALELRYSDECKDIFEL